jgi:radical SAM superfamily enzyme YgiQ (UPF0313 family)
MKNIYFIEPKSPGAHIFSKYPLPRLGSIILGTMLKARGYNVKVFIEDIAEPPIETFNDADLICISSITSTAPRAFMLADRFREKGVPVAIGGPHSSFLPEESLRHADYVIRGEGEDTMLELVDALEGKRSFASIRGLSYIDEDGRPIHNPDRGLVPDLDAAPIPDFDIVYKWKERAKIIPIATSRGCPFACKFCSVIQMFGRRYRFKSIPRVIEEIKSSIGGKDPFIFFVDDNFAANKNRTKELLLTILDSGLKFEWSAQVRTDVARDPELVRLMKESGCHTLYIGFESINPKTLSLYNKSQNVEDIENSIRLLKKYGIRIHGMFVFGSDTDDIPTIKNTVKFARKLDIDTIQFMMLTPLPGTPVFDEISREGRLIHTDWSKYDAHHAVFEPKLMTPIELHTETLKAMSKFYSWSSIIKNFFQGDFSYVLIHLYGYWLVKKSITNSKHYLESLKVKICKHIEDKASEIRRLIKKYYQTRRGKIILDSSFMSNIELKFFSTFLKNLNNKLVISIGSDDNEKGILTIIPVVRDIKEKGDQGIKQIQEFIEKKKDNIIDIKSISLYRTCVEIGLILNANMKKIRRAYDKALKNIGGQMFECNEVLLKIK